VTNLEESKFVVTNVFESMEAILRSSGTAYAVPVFEPEARHLLSNRVRSESLRSEDGHSRIID